MIDQIEQYEELERGWNGYDAPQIDPEVCEEAKRVVPKLPSGDGWKSSSEVFPTGRGTIQFEFTNKEGTEIEFEIFGRNRGELLVDPKLDEMKSWKGEIERCIDIINSYAE